MQNGSSVGAHTLHSTSLSMSGTESHAQSALFNKICPNFAPQSSGAGFSEIRWNLFREGGRALLVGYWYWSEQTSSLSSTDDHGLLLPTTEMYLCFFIRKGQKKIEHVEKKLGVLARISHKTTTSNRGTL